ncbi:DegT/DnrJ/EryC1/StrS family aminotransferase [candidate division KSB1 bacterium]|nr:DegT/DnrJ/EryC1/StrS family aminotransferase [candidate division KSB1 bacterium]
MIPHNKPTLGKEEENAALRVIRSGWLAQGNQVNAFEDEFCQFLNLPQGHAVAVSSGTAALFVALWAVNAKNKIVAFPVYVCSALRNAIAMVGAREYLVDVAEGSPNIDLEIVKMSNPDIVILPHMYGIPIDINTLEGMNVIEDCCQSLGATVDGKATGLKGDLGIFSFYATKLMTSGGHGGMVISKEKHLIDMIRDYREFDCRDDDKKRFNFQMTDLQAAIGREQLRKLPDFLNRREEIFKMYKDAGLDLLDVKEEDRGSLIPIRYRAVLKTDSPAEVIERLANNNIKAIIPIEDRELLGDSSRFPNALQMTKKAVSIPCYPLLTDTEAMKIIQVLGLS